MRLCIGFTSLITWNYLIRRCKKIIVIRDYIFAVCVHIKWMSVRQMRQVFLNILWLSDGVTHANSTQLQYKHAFQSQKLPINKHARNSLQTPVFRKSISFHLKHVAQYTYLQTFLS